MKHPAFGRTYTNFRGRITPAQKSALERYSGLYSCTDSMSLADLVRDGGYKGIGLEIGFGMGVELMRWAEEAPDTLIVGIELYKPGIGSLFANLARKCIENVRVMEAPGQLVLNEFSDNSVQEIRIFFPDPWPKKKHAKRRLIQDDFVVQLERVLIGGGILHIATDWEPYARWIEDCFKIIDGLRILSDASALAERKNRYRGVPTKFEKRGMDLKHEVFDFIFVKRGA